MAAQPAAAQADEETGVKPFSLTPKQRQAKGLLAGKQRHTMLVGGSRCVAGDTIIDGQSKTIAELAAIGLPIEVITSHGRQMAEAPFRKGRAKLLLVKLESGRQIEVTPDHRFWNGNAWVFAGSLSAGSLVAVRSFLRAPQESNLARGRLAFRANVRRWIQKPLSFLARCFAYCHQYGQPLRQVLAAGQAFHASRFCESARSQIGQCQRARAFELRVSNSHKARPLPRAEECSQNDQASCRPSMKGDFRQSDYGFGLLGRACARIFGSFLDLRSKDQQFQARFCHRQSFAIGPEFGQAQFCQFEDRASDIPLSSGYMLDKVLSVTDAAVQDFYTLHVPATEQYFANGILHHNSGKTFLLCIAVLTRAGKAPGSRHAIFRLRANAAHASITLDTMPKAAAALFGRGAVKYHGDGYFVLPNGAQIWIAGLDDKQRVEKILGMEFATLYFNECSQIPYESVLLAMTRLAQVVKDDGRGETLTQRCYYDLNPSGKGHWTYRLFIEKRDPVTGRPLPDAHNYQHLYMNPHDNTENLDKAYFEVLDALPERMRKRFKEGVYQPAVEGALWEIEQIEALRRDLDEMPDLIRVVVAIDPSGARDANDIARDEIGIIVGGRGTDGHVYVLADLSTLDSPEKWGRRAVMGYHVHKADAIIGEQNFGGAMVKFVVQTADNQVRYKDVNASRGKVVRAEPVSALYEQGKVHHVGDSAQWGKLEDELTAFSTSGYEGTGSPNRADALVWLVTELLLADPAQAWLDHYTDAAAAAADQPPPPDDDNRPWIPAEAKPQTSVTNELTELYNQTVRANAAKAMACKECGKPIAGSRTTDGVDVWHPECARF